jgi:hypothetical protein
VTYDPHQSIFDDLLSRSTSSAVHLEMRDEYTPDDPVFHDWKAGVSINPRERWPDWYGLVRNTIARGVVVRRARIVSEPVTDYIRYEYDVTEGLNLAAGEEVRWLPRRQASDIALPGNDFWVFDNCLVLFNIFAGDGTWPEDGTELREEPAVVALCTNAFEAVWQRAIPHREYHVSRRATNDPQETTARHHHSP